MKEIILILFSVFFFFCNSIVPLWDLNKCATDLLGSYNYAEYTIYHIKKTYNELKMVKRIEKSDGIITSSNWISLNNKNFQEVHFDNIENFFNALGKIIICPFGKNHPYDYSDGKNFTSSDFEEKRDWDLKCIWHYNSQNFLVSYSPQKSKNFFYAYIKGNNVNWGEIETFTDEFYDYKIGNITIANGVYPMIHALKFKDNLSFIRYDIPIKQGQVGEFSQEKKTFIIKNLKTTKGFFKNNSTKFYFITYNDTKNFISGYTNTTFDDNFDLNNVSFIINTSSPFEFDDSIEIVEINFILRNKFIYYKLKQNDIFYHGIIDIELNKIIFNTNEMILSFIPYSDKAMLAITPKTAYRICTYNDGNHCVDYCPEGYILDTSGNRCKNISNDCSPKQYILMPEKKCVDSCNTTINIEKGKECGPCGYFYPKSPYKFLNGTECLNYIPNESVIYDEDLYILICKEGFHLLNDTICEKDIICYNTCKSCKEEPKDEFHQNCLDCIEGYLFEKGNCLLNCSTGF